MKLVPYQDVDPEVVFRVVDEVRLGDVLLHDQGSLLRNLGKQGQHENWSLVVRLT